PLERLWKGAAVVTAVICICCASSFLFIYPTPTHIYTLSLHVALPISTGASGCGVARAAGLSLAGQQPPSATAASAPASPPSTARREAGPATRLRTGTVNTIGANRRYPGGRNRALGAPQPPWRVTASYALPRP